MLCITSVFLYSVTDVSYGLYNLYLVFIEIIIINVKYFAKSKNFGGDTRPDTITATANILDVFRGIIPAE